MSILTETLEHVNFSAFSEGRNPLAAPATLPTVAHHHYITSHNGVWTVRNGDGSFVSEHTNPGAADLALYVLNLPDITGCKLRMPWSTFGLPLGRAQGLARRQGHDLQLFDSVIGRNGLYVASCRGCRKTAFILPDMEIVGLAIRTKCTGKRED
jgi:hypothetical protein